ncbi:hypothetical protein G7Y89_g11273 [Cudoniella acicularis]|uniref:Protein kinase domain-containing protein n=1 Tax=Cudoniella acicularis TaxID=354080 RepID=A0A8H4RDF5_9HELO|nr:hypothetical protein G7Y89_g11273 [Cudoniella acicularis]
MHMNLSRAGLIIVFKVSLLSLVKVAKDDQAHDTWNASTVRTADGEANPVLGEGYGTFESPISIHSTTINYNNVAFKFTRTAPTEPSDMGREESTGFTPRTAESSIREDLNHDLAILASVGDQFGELSTSNHDDVEGGSVQTLEEQLLDAQIEWPENGNQWFIPANAIKELLNPESITIELRRNIEFSRVGPLSQLAKTISEKAPKLFAILVRRGRSKYIWNFLNEKIDDSHLPFVRADDILEGAKTGRFKLCSCHRPRQPLKTMETWNRQDIIDFGRDQWVMLAPVFEESKEVKHYNLDANCVMPFIEDQERTSQASGGFSSVWGVRIHPAHQFLYRGTNPENPNPLMALKRLHSTIKEDFDLEVEMLKNFSNNTNPHLVKLLATYSLKGHYYLVFPLAKANLRKYWELTPTPDFSLTTISWVLRQCKGIASAIMAIHEFKSSIPPSERRKSISGGSVTGGGSDFLGPPNIQQRGRSNSDRLSPKAELVESERLYGRHGDIKPENILWSDENARGQQRIYKKEGLLLLADFGLMDFHGKLTKSNVPADTVKGSPSYEPPERRVGTNISRAYDLWSLGCVYLEFITWLVCGWEELDKFPVVRDKTAIGGYTYDDTFFTLVNDERRAIVRESVTEWIKDLHEKPRCSQFIHKFLDLVSKDMLVVDPSKRITCGPLNKKLANMLEQADADPNYLTEPNPFPPRDRNEAAERVTRLLHGEHESSPPPSPREGLALPIYEVPNTLDSVTKSAQLRSLPRLSISEVPPSTFEASPFVNSGPEKASSAGESAMHLEREESQQAATGPVFLPIFKFKRTQYTAHRRNIRSSYALGDVLILRNEVLTYSTSTTSYSRIFITYDFKVLILAFLRKGDTTVVLKVYNIAVKLKVMSRELFLLDEIVISNEERISVGDLAFSSKLLYFYYSFLDGYLECYFLVDITYLSGNNKYISVLREFLTSEVLSYVYSDLRLRGLGELRAIVVVAFDFSDVLLVRLNFVDVGLGLHILCFLFNDVNECLY